MEPFLKWAGGKRWLTNSEASLFPDPLNYNKYYEPFLGSAAVFFHLLPSGGILSDLNPDLVNSYLAIKNAPGALYEILTKYHNCHSKDFYYQVRSSKPTTSLFKAARFIYLNRTCWNGLYRVNKQGAFNVPKGTKSSVIFDGENFGDIAEALKYMELHVCDFTATIDSAKEGDFLFIDPPYTVKHNLNGFLKYNEHIFSWDDQIRLKNAVIKAKNKGVKILVLNANHDSIKQLYKGIGEYKILKRASVIAGASNFRGIYSELAIKCWKDE